MATGSHHLVGEFEQLTNFLEQHPEITLVNTEGQPPDTFEIQYSLNGYSKAEDGSVEISVTHRVRINLPFGYPYFAPTVKPLTSIFHPEIDPAAVRIADTWQNNPSLTGLVLHIAGMISGNIYSLEDPFNQEAADWYQTHAHELPLSKITDSKVETDLKMDIDTLEDDIFSSLDIEEEPDVTLIDSAPGKKQREAELAAQGDYIRGLIAEKKLFEASGILNDLNDSGRLDSNLSVLLQGTTHQLDKVEEHYSLAQQLEEIGKPDEALEILGKLHEIAIDAPGADDFRSRLEMVANLTPQNKNSHQANDKRNPPPVPPPASGTNNVKPKKRPKRNAIGATDFLSRLPVKTILLFTLLIVLCAGVAKYYFQDSETLNRTETAILKSKMLMNKGQYENAQQQLNAAKASLSRLTILRLKKTTFEQEIDSLLSSRALLEGLKGHVLYKGKYHPAQTAKALEEFAVLTTQAEKVLEQGQISSALTLFKQAQRYAQENNLSAQAAEQEKTIRDLELKTTLTLAHKAEISQDWKSAEATYRRALKLSRSLSDPRTANLITSRLTAVSFRHELDQSKKSFTKEQWNDTIKNLEHAKELIDSDPDVVSPRERQDLNRLLVNARLYDILSEAKDLFNNGNWNKALDNYSDALELLVAEALNFEGLLDDSIYKIKRTMLLVQIAQIQEIVYRAEKADDTEEIITQSKNILQLIETSSIPEDPDIIEISDKVRQQVKAHEEKLAMDKKVNWLIKNYKEIFRKYYPAFEGSELVSPKVTLLKEEEGRTIFTVTCVERSKGSASRLELNYMHGGTTDTWSVYTGE